MINENAFDLKFEKKQLYFKKHVYFTETTKLERKNVLSCIFKASKLVKIPFTKAVKAKIIL